MVRHRREPVARRRTVRSRRWSAEERGSWPLPRRARRGPAQPLRSWSSPRRPLAQRRVPLPTQSVPDLPRIARAYCLLHQPPDGRGSLASRCYFVLCFLHFFFLADAAERLCFFFLHFRL